MSETKPNNGLEPLMPYSMPKESSGSSCLALIGKPMRWLVSKAKRVGLVVGLSALVIGGCATKTVTIKPECEIPQLAPLPVIMSDDIECLGDDVYWGLMDRERLLTDWALRMEATLEVVCKKSPE